MIINGVAGCGTSAMSSALWLIMANNYQCNGVNDVASLDILRWQSVLWSLQIPLSYMRGGRNTVNAVWGDLIATPSMIVSRSEADTDPVNEEVLDPGPENSPTAQESEETT